MSARIYDPRIELNVLHGAPIQEILDVAHRYGQNPQTIYREWEKAGTLESYKQYLTQKESERTAGLEQARNIVMQSQQQDRPVFPQGKMESLSPQFITKPTIYEYTPPSATVPVITVEKPTVKAKAVVNKEVVKIPVVEPTIQMQGEQTLESRIVAVNTEAENLKMMSKEIEAKRGGISVPSTSNLDSLKSQIAEQQSDVQSNALFLTNRYGYIMTYHEDINRTRPDVIEKFNTDVERFNESTKLLESNIKKYNDELGSYTSQTREAYTRQDVINREIESYNQRLSLYQSNAEALSKDVAIYNLGIKAANIINPLANIVRQVMRASIEQQSQQLLATAQITFEATKIAAEIPASIVVSTAIPMGIPKVLATGIGRIGVSSAIGGGLSFVFSGGNVEEAYKSAIISGTLAGLGELVLPIVSGIVVGAKGYFNPKMAKNVVTLPQFTESDTKILARVGENYVLKNELIERAKVTDFLLEQASKSGTILLTEERTMLGGSDIDDWAVRQYTKIIGGEVGGKVGGSFVRDSSGMISILKQEPRTTLSTLALTDAMRRQITQTLIATKTATSVLPAISQYASLVAGVQSIVRTSSKTPLSSFFKTLPKENIPKFVERVNITSFVTPLGKTIVEPKIKQIETARTIQEYNPNIVETEFPSSIVSPFKKKPIIYEEHDYTFPFMQEQLSSTPNIQTNLTKDFSKIISGERAGTGGILSTPPFLKRESKTFPSLLPKTITKPELSLSPNESLKLDLQQNLNTVQTQVPSIDSLTKQITRTVQIPKFIPRTPTSTPSIPTFKPPSNYSRAQKVSTITMKSLKGGWFGRKYPIPTPKQTWERGFDLKAELKRVGVRTKK